MILPIAANGHRNRPTTHPIASAVALLGLATVPLGIVGWVWAGDWRWAVTGLLVMVAMFIASGVTNLVLTREFRKNPSGILKPPAT
jgi:type IV secretory pathway VirB2 component (pilin)